jgi:acyl-homoserine lactone acylase PvdQ
MLHLVLPDCRRLLLGLAALLGPALANAETPAPLATAADEAAWSLQLAQRVTILRDRYGVPHVDGQDDEAVLFGFAVAQAEDNFWQVEDNFLLSLGRYSEAHGATGFHSDLLNRAFEVVSHSRSHFSRLEPRLQRLCTAFTAGLNYYLATHPAVRPRLIDRFEPWHVLAWGRHMTLELCFRYTRLHHSYLPRSYPRVWSAAGSNGWAIGPRRTAAGHALLLSNPHLPCFGFGQLYEAHLRSGQGWSFTGASMFGSPVLNLGHNEYLGWTLTTNEPDVADLWRLTFDDPHRPLAYRFGDGYRLAQEWTETIPVRTATGLAQRRVSLRKSHYGPIVAREDETHFLAAAIAGFYEALPMDQTLALMRARNLPEFRQGLARQQFTIMNVLYADRDGNILFLYNGLIPRRDPQFDWSRPVDGGDPRTAWRGLHALNELPEVLNPPAAYVQNCNSSPFTTTTAGNPLPERFPRYMIEDRDDDKRRAKRSRQILDAAYSLTFEQLAELAFDTTVYWAQVELPRYRQRLEELRGSQPDLARRAAPYFDHLLAWDCRVTPESTAATLCAAWYDRLYGVEYPGETLLPQFAQHPELEFEALILAASALRAMHGNWQVPWGQVFRAQRQSRVVDLLSFPFDDAQPSLPSLGVPGPLGAVLTCYYSPSLKVPFWRTLERRYALVGTTYLGVYEFGPRVRGATLVHFGASGDRNSPHYFDQAELLAAGRLKPELFHWEDVLAGAVETYHPGQRPPRAAR